MSTPPGMKVVMGYILIGLGIRLLGLSGWVVLALISIALGFVAFLRGISDPRAFD